MAFLGLAGGDRGKFIDLSVWPDSTLKSALDTLKAAGTNFQDRLLIWATSANMTVSICGNDTIPHMRILTHELDPDNGYLLTCRVWAFVDVASGVHPAGNGAYLFYYGTGTIALGQQILVNGADYRYVDGVNSGGIGKVVSKDDPTGTVLVAI